MVSSKKAHPHDDQMWEEDLEPEVDHDADGEFDEAVVSPLIPNDIEFANKLQEAMSFGMAKDAELETGRHNDGALKVQVDGKMWLLKPNPNRTSKAAGMNESSASCSKRDAAFYKLACIFGVGNRIPDTKVIYINDKEYSALEWVEGVVNVGKLNKVNSAFIQATLTKYAQSGELFKWAILDGIGGNVDRHSQNMMITKDDSQPSIVLIDHGATFSGSQFNPAKDPNSFVPFYLRAWLPNRWPMASDEEKMAFAPDCIDSLAKIKAWVNSIDPSQIASELAPYDVDTLHVLNRLQALKDFLNSDAPGASENFIMDWYLNHLSQS